MDNKILFGGCSLKTFSPQEDTNLSPVSFFWGGGGWGDSISKKVLLKLKGMTKTWAVHFIRESPLWIQMVATCTWKECTTFHQKTYILFPKTNFKLRGLFTFKRLEENKFNRPFATNDHMVQNPPCWRASSLISQCRNNNELALQYGGFCTM